MSFLGLAHERRLDAQQRLLSRLLSAGNMLDAYGLLLAVKQTELLATHLAGRKSSTRRATSKVLAYWPSLSHDAK
jgi:hypothetical protein